MPDVLLSSAITQALPKATQPPFLWCSPDSQAHLGTRSLHLGVPVSRL
jgi:hypothetical protein